MADFLTKAERSRQMGRVKGTGNRSTEIKLIQIFCQMRIKGWRRGNHLPGSPDFTFRNERVVVFVDGCFWHGCAEHYTVPVTNAEFWRDKRLANIARDRRVDAALRQLGWRVVRIWEHDLRTKQVTGLVRRLRRVFRLTTTSAMRRSKRSAKPRSGST
jgi:DNA mismatch endonuclease, patch repair protein